MVCAGFQSSVRMLMQIRPLLLMLQWYMRVRNTICHSPNHARIQNKRGTAAEVVSHLGRFERVFRRERDVEREDTASVRRTCWPNDGRYPLEEVVLFGPGRDAGWRVEADLIELLLNPGRRA